MAEWAKKERFSFETICPLCLERYPPNEIVVEYPFCPECSGEAIDYPVEAFEKYLGSKTTRDFDEMLINWEAKDGIRAE